MRIVHHRQRSMRLSYTIKEGHYFNSEVGRDKQDHAQNPDLLLQPSPRISHSETDPEKEAWGEMSHGRAWLLDTVRR